MKPKQTKKTAQASLIDKLRGGEGGPVTFSTLEERARLLAAISRLQTQENLQDSDERMVTGISEALTRHNLQVTDTTNPDGSKGFDLENVPDTEPDTEPITVN